MVQQKAFTRWINSHLRKRSLAINELFTDLKNGVNLINLYEIISDEKFTTKWYPKPNSRFQEIANVGLVVGKINQFVQSVGIKVQFGPEQVIEGVKQQVLGMIWCLIHKFEIQDISEEQLSAREGLLLWCKKKTAGYKDVNVKDFNYSFEDGLAFAALIHKHRPDLIDFDSLKKEDKLDNLQKVFDIAEKALDIPQLLDAQDMVKYKPDDKAVMAYVAYYWKKFAGSAKNEKAAKMIGSAAKRQKELEELQHDYERRARALVQWIKESSAKLSDTDFSPYNSLAKSVGKNNEFKDFKNNQRPVRYHEKNDLEVLLANIRSKQKNEGLPVFEPAEDITTAAINGDWEQLTELQEAYEKLLSTHIGLMKRLEILLGRVRSKAENVSAWQNEKSSGVLTEDPTTIETITLLQGRVRVQEAIPEEAENVNRSIKVITTAGTEIVQHNHESAPEVQQILDTIPAKQEEILKAVEALLTRFKEELARREEIVRKCLEYAKKSESLTLYCDDAILSLSEPVRASSVKDLESYEQTVDVIKGEEEKNQKYVQDLAALDEALKGQADLTEYTKSTQADLEAKFAKVQELLAAKVKEISAEMIVQKRREELLNHFNAEVKLYNDWIKQTNDKIGSNVNGSLEEQQEAIRKLGEVSVKESDQRLKVLVEEYKKLEEEDIAEQSPVSLQALNVMGTLVPEFLKKRLAGIEQQLVAQKAQGLTPEQIKEFRDTFNHFDKDRDGQLTKLDFKACCAAIGEDIPDEELNQVFAGYDKNNDGKISFDEFIEFMVKINKEGTGYEDVLNAFGQIAGGREFVTEAEIRASLEKEEAEYILSKMPKVAEGYDYKTYVAQTYGK